MFIQRYYLWLFSLLFLCRTTHDDKEGDEDEDIDHFNLHDDTQNFSLFIYRPRVRVLRLNEAEVACARQKRLKELHMWSIIRQIIIYSCFFSLLCILTYSNQNSNSFLQVNHLRKFFLNTRQIDNDYTKV